MWDNLAKQFDKNKIEKLAQPIIIAVRTCRVTRFKGTDVKLSALSASHYYINPIIPEAEQAHTTIGCKVQKSKPTEIRDIIGIKHVFQIHFLTSTQKGAGEFIVDDILDMHPAVEGADTIDKITT
ncbi:hypothetical protein Tco_1011800, partial [Tanacetum coccineum]